MDNETGLGLGTGEQSQSGTAAPSKCTDPRIPGGGFGAAWQSLGEVVMGDSGTVVRWTTYTELALAGIGCAKVRAAGEESYASHGSKLLAERNHKSASPLIFAIGRT